jgi:hypothetical protein
VHPAAGVSASLANPNHTSPATLQIASAAFPALMRLGSGGFASGYSSGLVEDDGRYGVVKASGRKVLESSKVRAGPGTLG